MKPGRLLPLCLFHLVLVSSQPPLAAAEGPAEGNVSGRVLKAGGAVEGVHVEVHAGRRGAGRSLPIQSAVSDRAGRYGLRLPPGTYYLSFLEEASPPQPSLVVDHPENPVAVRAGDSLDLAPVDLAGGAEAGSEREDQAAEVRGRVVRGSRPVRGASVMFYDGSAERLVGPGFAWTATSDDDGRFRVNLSAGLYRVAVRKRMREAGFGPPAPGDLAGEYAGNPIRVEGGLAELGAIDLHEVDPEELGRRLEGLDRPQPGLTTIAGEVLDQEGKPLPGQFVFLYEDAQLRGRPLFVTRSDENGRFLLNVPEGRRFFVSARNRYGGRLQPGDMIGRLEGSDDSSVGVDVGDRIGGLVIRMERAW